MEEKKKEQERGETRDEGDERRRIATSRPDVIAMQNRRGARSRAPTRRSEKEFSLFAGLRMHETQAAIFMARF